MNSNKEIFAIFYEESDYDYYVKDLVGIVSGETNANNIITCLDKQARDRDMLRYVFNIWRDSDLFERYHSLVYGPEWTRLYKEITDQFCKQHLTKYYDKNAALQSILSTKTLRELKWWRGNKGEYTVEKTVFI